MSKVQLIADAGSTKSEWCLLQNGKKKTIILPGISPYFLSVDQIASLLNNELLPKLKKVTVDEIHYYGTGCAAEKNARLVKKSLQKLFPSAKIHVLHDVYAAARGLCGKQHGVASILGTGSSSCYYNGKKIVINRPGIGYALGDEGSGSYLGRKVIQYYLYNTFDDDLRARFDATFITTPAEILDNVYKAPLPNRYLASFAKFLAENRGHYMVENIIEDGLNEYFFTHLCKYSQAWKYPVSFVGGIAYGFKDVIKDLCNSYNFELGKILRTPMKGLIEFHSM